MNTGLKRKDLLPLKTFFENCYNKIGPRACVGIGLAALVLGLYHSALTGWWRWDDTQILKQAFEYSPWEYFFLPDAYQILSLKSFTPWLILSFEADLSLFGLNPTFFYLHQLIMLWLAALATFLLLRLWLPFIWSALASALCVIGAPLASVSQQLMTRHYLEGLVCSLFALYLLVFSLREGKRYLSWLGAILYLIAMSAKEIYVPLALVCVFLPEGKFRGRLTAVIPFFLALLAYLPWRYHMLGTIKGGYPLDWNSIFYLPPRVCNALLGQGIIGIVVGLMVCSVLAITLLRKGKNVRLFSLMLIISTIGPLLPLADSVSQGRYLLVIWWALSIGLVSALGLWNLPKTRYVLLARYAIYCLVALCALIHTNHVGLSLSPITNRFDVQGRFVWDLDGRRKLMYSPRISAFSHYFAGLLWLKHYKQEILPHLRIMGDEIELANLPPAHGGIWGYSDQCVCMQDISDKVPGILERWKRRLSVKPLRIELDYFDYVITWQCGPYEKGPYHFISCDRKDPLSPCEWEGMTKFSLPPSGKWRLKLQFPLSFYLRYDSPQGWVTYSPLLHFDPGTDTKFSWAR